MFKTPKFQLVELIIPASIAGALQTVYFQSQPQLQSISGDQSVFIKAIEVFTIEDILSSPLSAGSPVANAKDVANATLALSVKGSLDFQYLPMSRLLNVQTNTAGAPTTNGHLFLLRNVWKIDWTKSYVTMILNPAGGGGLTAPQFSYLFGVHYGYAPDADDLSADSVVAAIAAKQGQGNPAHWVSNQPVNH